MKKTAIILCTALMFSGLTGICSESTDLSTVEKELFAVEYQGETTAARLNRIEKYIYGNVKQGTNSARLSNIMKTTGISTELPKVAQHPSEDYSYGNVTNGQNYTYDEPEDDSVSYPTVDRMEEKTFGKNFHGTDIYKRLANLEQKAFGKVSDGRDLTARTDALKASILAQKPEKITYDSDFTPHGGAAPYDYSTGVINGGRSNYDALYDSSGSSSLSGTDFAYGLSASERIIFGKTRTGSREERLAKLEKKIFKKTFENENSEARLERVVSAASGMKNSIGYNENKWGKYLETGIQVGGILLMILAMIL
ncbi:MAG: hypothetical protein ACI4CY_05965 [Candidatus Gastranaerophilaceae bacterium]